jgi:enoyl-[acyl-carrier protein] reductase II
MYPDVLKEHVRKCKAATGRPFAVNVPLLYPNVEEHMDTIVNERVPIVFTSAGDPRTWTSKLKEAGIIVVHVVSSVRFARKAEACGVDAVVAEGFEAGGHNGREETTTMVLIPMVRSAISIPLIAAGGIATGRAMVAAMALGADAVQVGSRFVCSQESSAHPAFKERVAMASEGDTVLTLKELAPVRLIRNGFQEQVQKLYERGTTVEELRSLLGRGRAKRGMFEGDLDEGELEIGQVAGQFTEVLPAGEIVRSIMAEYHEAVNDVSSLPTFAG